MFKRDYGHWELDDEVGEFDPEDHFGFVYRITNKMNGKKYIGCKHLKNYKKGKPVKVSDWKTYCSSSKYLKPDIEGLGKENFQFLILSLWKNKRDLYYNEVKQQIFEGALERDDYYNANVGGKRFYRPVSSYSSKKYLKNISGINNWSYKGAFKITFKDGKFIIVKNQTVKDFCIDNGYDKATLYKVVTGKRKSHKDVIGMEYVDAQD